MIPTRMADRLDRAEPTYQQAAAIARLTTQVADLQQTVQRLERVVLAQTMALAKAGIVEEAA
jgi:hypothetical protein